MGGGDTLSHRTARRAQRGRNCHADACQMLGSECLFNGRGGSKSSCAGLA